MEESKDIINIDDVKEKRGRGRPRKGLKFFRSPRRWQPLEWRPEYTEIVAMSVAGFSNTLIAEQKKVTPQHISNVLNTEEAIKLRAIVDEKWREKLINGFDEKMSKLESLAMDTAISIVGDAEVKKKNPIALLRESTSILKGMGRLKGEGVVINNTSTTGIPPEIMGGILEALEAGKRVEQKYKEISLDTDGKPIGIVDNGELKQLKA